MKRGIEEQEQKRRHRSEPRGHQVLAPPKPAGRNPLPHALHREVGVDEPHQVRDENQEEADLHRLVDEKVHGVPPVGLRRQSGEAEHQPVGK
jgi:hypothetical protein